MGGKMMIVVDDVMWLVTVARVGNVDQVSLQFFGGCFFGDGCFWCWIGSGGGSEGRYDFISWKSWLMKGAKKLITIKKLRQ
jgi:hypothetical protein